jgi:tetratricopeptide (TPR) repeat protein
MIRISLAFLFLALFSCSKTVFINTMRPATITFPPEVKSVLLVDRTAPSSKLLDVIEGIFTGELPGQDRAAIEVAIQAIQTQIMQVPSLTVKRANERLEGNTVTQAFPAPLSWTEIERLCRVYNTDILLAVEIFDSNFIITNGQKEVTKTITEDGVKKEVKVAEFFAEGVATNKIGFRIYDPVAKTIVDQDQFNQANTWQTTGNTAQAAIATLIAKSEATKYVARLAGSSYASKIVPTPIQLSRTYYKKSKENIHLRQGVRLAEVNQWKEAISSWKKGLISNPTAKDAEKLSYNIALGYEILGDFEEAKVWAAKAYTNYGNKKGRRYIPLLDQRIINEGLLNQQLKN